MNCEKLRLVESGEVWYNGHDAEVARMKKAIRVGLWILLMGLMTMIFWFSSQGSVETMKTSGRFAVPLTKWICSVFHQANFNQVLMNVQWIVRKCGHFSEYALLGGVTVVLLMSYRSRRPRLYAWLWSTFYAVTDELHQFLSGQRSGMWQDVVLDSLGALTGLMLAVWLVRRCFRHLSAKKEEKNKH